MSGIKILPNFVVKTGGVMSLRVVTLEFLRERGFDPNTGFGFTKEQSDRYGGKKLKLHKVFSDPDCAQGPGATRRLSFAADGDDTYNWNEYMFQEYWDAIGADRPRPVAKAATPRTPAKDVPRRVEPRVRAEPHKVYAPEPAPKKRNANSLLKVLLLMSVLNASLAKPAPAPAPTKGKTAKAADQTASG